MISFLSCNGCRVLHQRCQDNCTIRSCLKWINTAESQANATIFLSKFYGRTRLMNFIYAASDHHRPVLFRSLLYEACGRIVNPVSGLVGLYQSGNWKLCLDAVEAVFNGASIVQISSESPTLPFKAADIRHRPKARNSIVKAPKKAWNSMVKAPNCKRFKRSAVRPMPRPSMFESVLL